MNAAALLDGDRFIECTAEEWADLTEAQRSAKREHKVTDHPAPCITDATRVHLRTSAGHWCIPGAAEVILTD